MAEGQFEATLALAAETEGVDLQTVVGVVDAQSIDAPLPLAALCLLDTVARVVLFVTLEALQALAGGQVIPLAV